jgi:quinohemoprotein amine dehydrogenase
MASPARRIPPLVALGVVGGLLAWIPGPQEAPQGFAITNQTVVDRCSRCHAVDEDGRMTRISYLRKTPEGWQTSIRRMVSLHGARLDAADAREIVRYLADEQGVAPEELRPGLFEVERRMIDYDYPGDSGVEYTCIQCHSMGRVITQRRTREEWSLLLATHRGLYPLVDFQAFMAGGRSPSPDSDSEERRQPMDAAIAHLSEVFPLETPEWAAWAATKRPPQLSGTWGISGYEPGKGPLYGRVSITADAEDPSAFTTQTTYLYPESGETVSRSGQALVYTGYQWRGRSNPGQDSELREVMFVERDQEEMSGRWFTGAYDEVGLDVTLRRVRGNPVLSGVYPIAVRKGTTTTVTLYGGNLPTAQSGESGIDLGEGVQIAGVETRSAGTMSLRLAVAADARIGERDLFAFGSTLQRAIVVHDGVDRIAVTPEAGMARVGGANFPKGYQTFEAIGYDDGPDGESNTEDDLELGRVDASWSLDEYAAVFGDDDIDYVGTMGQDGTFTPALDGPNPDRRGSRNNVGDVWVVATHRSDDGTELTARSHLVVTVPLYLRWDPWREVDPRRILGGGGS